MLQDYDIIVVGAGHAGCEAAAAAAKLGSKVLLITSNMQNFAQMSCNPAMGGLAKGQLVREIDAMGGYSGIVSDMSAIQFRMLNKSKGPAMWSPRSQNDRMLFSIEWRNILENIHNLDFWQDMVTGILVKNDRINGVVTKMGLNIKAKSVILSNGTFLNGKIHIGEVQLEGGRIGEKSSTALTESINYFGLESGRMKTGTPVRVDGRSIDFNKMDEQKGDEDPSKFSFSSSTTPLSRQRSCFITYTNEECHNILRKGFDKSPLFNARILGVGPRYCPSIEDKIERFSDRNRHQLFIEPEGWNTVEYYVNGFSSSLPDYIQYEALKKIKGFENVKIFRPGYAIEYDYFNPQQLSHTLESKLIENLYFAGQINGTTGYEEAAAQGLIAGINAHQKINSLKSFVPDRSEAYIGVLIDDLVTKGTSEPYRMFTSRAEYRILLRQDNADIRLTEKSYHLGLADEGRYFKVRDKDRDINKILEFFQNESASPSELNKVIQISGGSPFTQRTKLINLILRPEIGIKVIGRVAENVRRFLEPFDNEIIEQAEIQMKYKTYIEKEKDFVIKMKKLEMITIPSDMDYKSLNSLSSEAKEKLDKIRPSSIGQASRISGVSPADISILLVFLGR